MTHPQLHQYVDSGLQTFCGKVQLVTLCFKIKSYLNVL